MCRFFSSPGARQLDPGALKLFFARQASFVVTLFLGLLVLTLAVPVLAWKPVAAPDAQNATCASDAQNATYTPDTQDTARTPNAENTASASDTEHTSRTVDTQDAEQASDTLEACVGGCRPSPQSGHHRLTRPCPVHAYARPFMFVCLFNACKTILCREGENSFEGGFL